MLFSNLFTIINNLFSDCCKYRDEPAYQEMVDNQEREYYSHGGGSVDPLWQDRRLLSFFHYRPKKNSTFSI